MAPIRSRGRSPKRPQRLSLESCRSATRVRSARCVARELERLELGDNGITDAGSPLVKGR